MRTPWTRGCLPAACLLAIAHPARPAEPPADPPAVRWVSGAGNSLDQPPGFYRGAEALRIAGTVLLTQRANGGWPKNYDRTRSLNKADREDLLARKHRNDTTFDNGSTHSEVRYLAKVHNATGDEQCRDACLRGVRFMLGAQCPNGGWPQFHPDARGYSRHITFNDGAMIGVLTTLQEVAVDPQSYPFADARMRARCADAVAAGVRCILACQIEVDGRKTGWCAQHDEQTLAPAGARSYELASISGCESVGVVRFLMQLDDPSPEIIAAVEAAVAWFGQARLTGIRLARVHDPSAPGGRDTVVVEDPSAPPLWARFYQIGTNKPIFCSRDGIPRDSLAAISHERRNGYSWLGGYAAELLARDYPAWRAKWRR